MIKDINVLKIKFLPISKKDLILALDRLTRFKYPEIKYYRVFSELLCKYLIEPKLSKSQIRDLDVCVLKKIIERLWNESVATHCPDILPNKYINKVILDETFSSYNLSEEIKSLVNADLNMSGVLSFIEDSVSAPVNLRRCIEIQKNNGDLLELREQKCLRFPVEKVVLCEGITEEILLPAFASLAGFNFDKYGVKLISAGGKNQVAKLYYELKDELKLPIFILLDADAVEISGLINSVKRENDFMYLIKHGEFEDIFSLNLIKRTINSRFKNICESTISDFRRDVPMTKVLAEFFRLHELGDFQKAEFAKELSKNLKYKTDLTDEIIEIVTYIKDLK